MKPIKKTAAFLLSAAMLLSASGCRNGETETGTAGGTEDFPETLTVFCGKSASLMEDMKDYNDVYAFQLLEEATGTHVEWNIPPGSGFEEKFNLLIASGNLPDIIVANWNNKGIQQYIDDGIIADLTEEIPQYMPNLMKYNHENPELARQYIFDGGKIFSFPYIRTDKKLNIFFGPVIRTDWLEKLNLEVPETADDLYEVLKAFKTGDPNGNGEADEIPMSEADSASSLGVLALLSMFDTRSDFYVKDKVVRYGIMEPEFEDGLRYVTKLYSEGLIDSDYLLQDRTALVGKITGGRVGFSYEYQPTQIMTTMEQSDPTFKFEGIPHFVNKDGIRRTMSTEYTQSVLDRSMAITTANKNPLGTLKWIDYIYSEEGHMIMNFGKEGDTYEMKDGIPTFTEKINNNQEGMTRSQVWGKNFATYNSYFPATQDWYSYSQYLSPHGLKAIETWADNVNTDLNLPLLTFNEEDRETITNIYTQIKTYVDEQVDKIILGQESIDRIPEIREKIKTMGIDTVLGLYQTAYDSYENKDIGF